jgi:hypothetical protein
MPRNMKSSATFDFEDEKFQAPPPEVLPWCQMINPLSGTDGLTSYGLAIKLDNAEAIGFTPDENWQEVDHEFSTGDVEPLYITTTPRLVIVRRGAVCIKNRETGAAIGRLIDHYDEFMADRLKFKTFTRHLIFFVGRDKKFLHQSPLRLSISGVAGASFGNCYRMVKGGQAIGGFTVELEKAYAEFRQQPFAQKGPLFHAHGIFCPLIQPETRGIGANTALVATTVDYEHPMGANFQDYIIASNSEESSMIQETFEQYEDFGQDIPKTEPEKPGTPSPIGSSYTFAGEEYEYEPLY